MRVAVWEWWRGNPGKTEFLREQEERDWTVKTDNSFNEFYHKRGQRNGSAAAGRCGIKTGYLFLRW